MPRFVVPNSVSIHNAHAFLRVNHPFENGQGEACLELHPRWAHMEPLALSMIASWGAWCRRQGMEVKVSNLGPKADYAARMKLFQHLGVDYDPGVKEHEEAGRFLPVTQVKTQEKVSAVIGDISALLHLTDDPDSLSAVRYCVSELLRNVLEHSGSPDGAFICAHRFTGKPPHRVTIAVADCGQGIASHLGRVRPEANINDIVALGLSMQPGVTGALPGVYGTSDNAGAGLFITRCIAKGTGGYFLLLSGSAAYRLRRSNDELDMTTLYADPYDEPRRDLWPLPSKWQGTVVTVEIRAEKIADYQEFFQWIFRQIPRRTSSRERIRFT